MVSQRSFRILLNSTLIAIPFSYFRDGVKIAINVCILMEMASPCFYKRLDNGKLQWPKNEQEVQSLSQQEILWLLEGLSLQQLKAVLKFEISVF